jgi:outer membrane protein assembly factor BamB
MLKHLAKLRPFFILVSVCSGAAPVAAVELLHVLSREHPAFDVAGSRLAVGRDGKVYLSSAEYVLRINRDGSRKLGSKLTASLWITTANADGVMAAASGHFNHNISLWSPNFERLDAVNDFLVNDQVEWYAPCDVQVGASGHFYGIDENRHRIVRVTAPGRLTATYTLAGLGEDLVRKIVQFRVWEAGQRFYILCPSNTLRVVAFDGKLLWSLQAGLGGNPWDGWRGSFDVDDQGRLFVLPDTADTIQVYDVHGKPAGELRLQMGERKGRVADLRVSGDDIFLRRPHPVELFQVYDRKTGAFKHVVQADVEQLNVKLPNDVWTAGEPVPVQINLDAGGRRLQPRWRLWLRPFNTPDFQELPLKDGKVLPPADAGGFYHLRVSTDVKGATSEYLVETIIEIRPPGTTGSVAVFTPLNRIYYGQGEAIPVSLLYRAAGASSLPQALTLCLWDGTQAVAEGVVKLESGKPAQVSLPSSVTGALRPGRYVLTAKAPGLAVASQHLVIGTGLRQPLLFNIVQHGDYHTSYPDGNYFNVPEKVAAHLARSRKLGINMFVDRLGHGYAGVLHLVNQTLSPTPLIERVRKDPLAVAPEKAVVEGPIRQTIAGYGAHGMEQRAILLSMDAGLPVGTGFDGRKPEQFAEAITNVTAGLASYPAFRGWSWAANWWPGRLGASAAPTPAQKAAYEAALKRANETGAWDAVLDQVSDVWLNHAVNAERQFRAALHKAAPGKLSVMTGPYRAVGVIPPLTFQNADEVDLHYQGEQIQPPQVTPHNVDFYKRSGKRAWGHPELWNDDGTGGMIFPTLFQMVMRGADGVGWSGNVPDWGSPPSDPRATGQGAISIYRNLNALFQHYGPWLTTLHNADKVAILCSSRMMRIDNWNKIGGRYFDQLFEAYNSCLYAHRPASFVFAEDIKADTLKAYQAVLIVGQRVALEPVLADALKAAAATGVKVFHDGTCRAELVQPSAPLGLAFDQVEKDPSAWQDDSAYVRIPRYFKKNAAVLRRLFDPIVPPVAVVENPEIMLTERRSGAARFVWVVNNTMLDLEPGIAWRVALIMSQRLPLVVPIRIDSADKVIYDLFALKQVRPEKDIITADLRSLPARLYAILPEPIAGVTLQGPQAVTAGCEFTWVAIVRDAHGKAINASLPVRLRLVAADGSVLAERYTSASHTTGAHGTFTLPLNPPTGPVTLEAVELISGKEARLSITAETSKVPSLFNREPEATAGHNTVASGSRLNSPSLRRCGTQVTGTQAGVSFTPSEQHFGPHCKDLAVSTDDTTVLVNAMNWDQNLYALDVRTGGVRWQQRIGHHFAYDPLPVTDGFAVQGFDLDSAEGYHLYLVNHEGKVDRRFALYGLPKRATHWANGSHLLDRINNFAVSPDRAWVAGAGDLGLAVWDPNGRLLWSQDWWKTTRQRMFLLAQDTDTLVTLLGATATAYRARTGQQLWQRVLADTGTLQGGAVSADRNTLALRSDTNGGRIFVLRHGQLLNTFPTAADALALSPTGNHLAVTTSNQLKWYTLDAGLEWTFTGDDLLRRPRMAPDGKRVSVGSELGTLYVLDALGKIHGQHDLGALPVSAWLPDGDLLAATWMGTVIRYDQALKERWRVRLQSDVTDVRPRLLTADATPTIRMTQWGNAAPTLALLSENLLKRTQVLIYVTMSDKRQELHHPPELLVNGKPDAPAKPWLDWTTINYVDSGWYGPLQLNVDAFRTQLKVTGITFVEDPAHPESWLRDVRLQYWDAAAEQWRDGPYLLANAAVHTHWLDKPIEAARFQFVSPGGGTWPAGNLRLGELVFHGEVLGASHPDVIAKRPVAVLFDEKESDLNALKHHGRPFSFRYDDAYSGGKCLALTSAGQTEAAWEPPFGHSVPNWDFEIVENPQPGQYRWLQFAWKSLAPQTTGMALLIGRSWPGGGINFVAGRHDWGQGVLATKRVADKPPSDWQVVRVDLWELARQPLRIQCLSLAAVGGGAAFDQILLGRTEADLLKVKPTK